MPELDLAMKALLVLAFGLWLEVRAFPLVKRALAGHRAVVRKLGVTDEDVAAELRVLEGGGKDTAA